MMSKEKEVATVDNFDVAYISRLLKDNNGKPQQFASKEELIDAENKFLAEQKSKEEKAAKRKAEATVVEDAFKKLNAVKAEGSEKIKQARLEYNKARAELDQKYFNEVKVVNEKIGLAEKDYNDALTDFNKNHPDGFRLNLRDGDNVVDIVRSTTVSNIDDFVESFFDMFNKFKF